MDYTQLFSCSSLSTEASVATIAAMCHQETFGYFTADSLRQRRTLLPIPLDVDEDCRKKMVAWSYQVVDFCKFNRETVEIAMSLFDRFLVTPSGTRALQDRSMFQLAAMTSLYTAVKIHEPEAMDPKLVSSLSRGTYSPEDIEKMEQIILQELHWRVNPPTALSFVREFFNLIPVDAMDESTRKLVFDLTKLQTELAVSENNFVAIKASVAAFCSFMNALESLCLDPKVIQYVGIMLQEATGISSCCSEQIFDVQSYLHTAVDGQPELQNTVTTKLLVSPRAVSRRVIVHVSPRSVMHEQI